MAKKSKKSNQKNLDPVKVKLAFLIFLTVVLCLSAYALFNKDNGGASITEPIRIEGKN